VTLAKGEDLFECLIISLIISLVASGPVLLFHPPMPPD